MGAVAAAMDARRGAAWLAFGALFAANFYPTFKWMIMRWDEPDSYVSHGWLIAPISIWLLWRERAQLARIPLTPSPRIGFLVVAAALLVHLVCGVADVSSISALSMVALLSGFAIMINGLPWFRKAWFAFAFLFMMVPLPEFLISWLNFNLKLQASDFAASLLDLFGMPTIREGSYLIFGKEKLVVGDVCSGLRSLLSLFALGILYAYLVREKGRSQVAAVLLATLPAAVIGNGIRIFVVCLLVAGLGSEAVFKPMVGSVDLHLITGGLIFLGAFSVLFGLSAAIEALRSVIRKPQPPAVTPP